MRNFKEKIAFIGSLIVVIMILCAVGLNLNSITPAEDPVITLDQTSIEVSADQTQITISGNVSTTEDIENPVILVSTPENPIDTTDNTKKTSNATLTPSGSFTEMITVDPSNLDYVNNANYTVILWDNTPKTEGEDAPVNGVVTSAEVSVKLAAPTLSWHQDTATKINAENVYYTIDEDYVDLKFNVSKCVAGKGLKIKYGTGSINFASDPETEPETEITLLNMDASSGKSYTFEIYSGDTKIGTSELNVSFEKPSLEIVSMTTTDGAESGRQVTLTEGVANINSDEGRLIVALSIKGVDGIDLNRIKVQREYFSEDSDPQRIRQCNYDSSNNNFMAEIYLKPGREKSENGNVYTFQLLIDNNIIFSMPITVKLANPTIVFPAGVDADDINVIEWNGINKELTADIKNNRSDENTFVMIDKNASLTVTDVISTRDGGADNLYKKVGQSNTYKICFDESIINSVELSRGSTQIPYYVYVLYDDGSSKYIKKIGSIMFKDVNPEITIWDWKGTGKNNGPAYFKDNSVNKLFTSEYDKANNSANFVLRLNSVLTGDRDTVFWSETEYVDSDDIIEAFGKSLDEAKCNVYGYMYNPGLPVVNFQVPTSDTSKTYYLYLVRTRNNTEVIPYDLGSVTVIQNALPVIEASSSSVSNGKMNISVKAKDMDNGLEKAYVILYDENNNPLTNDTTFTTPFSVEIGDSEEISVEVDETQFPSYKYAKLFVSDKFGEVSVCEQIFSNSDNPVIEYTVENATKVQRPSLQGKKDTYNDFKDTDVLYVSSNGEVKLTFNIKKCLNPEDPDAPNVELKSTSFQLMLNDKNKTSKCTFKISDDKNTATCNISNLKQLYKKDDDSYDPIPKLIRVLLTVTTKDSTGTNSYSTPIEFYLMWDKSAPKIEEVRMNGSAENLLESTSNGYAAVTNKDVKLCVKVKDDGVVKTDKFLYYVNGNSDEIKECTQFERVDHVFNGSVDDYADTANGEDWYELSFNEDIKAETISLLPIDAVGNQPSDYKTTNKGFIIEHSCHIKLSLSVDNSSHADKNGNPLYSGDVTVNLVIEGGLSGIKDNNPVEMPQLNYSYPNGDTKRIDMKDAKRAYDNIDGNIVTRIECSFPLSNIDVDGIEFSCCAWDNAGNPRYDSEKKKISIDRTAPKIEVKFDDTKGDPDFENFYAKERTATVTVTERNFNKASVEKLFTANNGVKPTFSAWTEKSNVEDPNKTTYTATVTFTEDGTYNLSGTIEDLAGNKSNTLTIPEFSIDKVKPEIKVTFDVTKAKDSYYSVVRTATVTVTDKSFDPGRVKIEGKLTNSELKNFPGVGNWTKAGDTYTAKITFDKDGTYSFAYSVKDKAGNESDKDTVQEFTVDLSDPEIDIAGVDDKTAYRGRAVPVIKIDDANVDNSMISLQLVGDRNGKIDISQMYSVEDNGTKYIFKDFEYVPEMDDVYTLTITATDKAGNKTTKTIKFSINRFGSSYELGETLKKINNTFVKVVSGVKFAEINVDELKMDSIKVTLTVNGVPKTLTINKDFTLKKVADSGAWNKYEYVLNDELFAEDGTYVITVSSVDMAENINEISNKEKGEGIKFGIDTVAPIITPLNIESDEFYKANNYEALVSVKDNLSIAGTSATVDGKNVQIFSSEDETYSFTISESNNPQNIEVRAFDEAGNESVIRVDHVLVSGNLMVRLMRNKMALFGIIGGGGVAVVGGALFFILKRRF